MFSCNFKSTNLIATPEYQAIDQFTAKDIEVERVVITHRRFVHVKRQARAIRPPIIVEVIETDSNGEGSSKPSSEAKEASFTTPPTLQ